MPGLFFIAFPGCEETLLVVPGELELLFRVWSYRAGGALEGVALFVGLIALPSDLWTHGLQV